MQDPAFAQALRLCGQNPVTLPNGQLLLLRKLWGMSVAMLPRAIPPRDFPSQLRTVRLDRMPVILSPTTPCTTIGAYPLPGSQERAMLDLNGNDAEARARLHPKWRNQLKRAEQNTLQISIGPLEKQECEKILKIEHWQAKARGYANWPTALTSAFAISAPDQTCYSKVKIKDHTVAHMLFFTHGINASYHIGHITPLGKKLCAHNLLLWRSARHLAAQGYETLDLGVLNNATAGLNRFKLRTGAQRQKTGGTLLYWHPFASRASVKQPFFFCSSQLFLPLNKRLRGFVKLYWRAGK
jgi:hypothetical protein